MLTHLRGGEFSLNLLKFLESLSPEEYCKVVSNTAYYAYEKAKKNLVDSSFKEHDSWDEVMVCLYNTVKFTSC